MKFFITGLDSKCQHIISDLNIWLSVKKLGDLSFKVVRTEANLHLRKSKYARDLLVKIHEWL